MKSEVTMDFLADKLKLSKTTISKAINHCPGISQQTKHMINEAASNYGYNSKRPIRSECNVAVVLPSVPDYFWGAMKSGIDLLSKKDGVKTSYYIYPNLLDNSSALQCINQALSTNISVLITAVPDSPEIRRKLEFAASSILVILIEEFIDIKNVFFVGENSYYQGYSIGKEYITAYPTSEHFSVLRSTGFFSEKMRIEGFMAALKDCNKNTAGDIIEDSTIKSNSAYIARQLADLKNIPDCIFCPSGSILHAASAVQKLKKNIHCIGFDMHAKGNIYSQNITHLFLQDIDAQVKKVWEYTRSFLASSVFPDSKSTYIDNIIYDKSVI